VLPGLVAGVEEAASSRSSGAAASGSGGRLGQRALVVVDARNRSGQTAGQLAQERPLARPHVEHAPDLATSGGPRRSAARADRWTSSGPPGRRRGGRLLEGKVRLHQRRHRVLTENPLSRRPSMAPPGVRDTEPPRGAGCFEHETATASSTRAALCDRSRVRGGQLPAGRLRLPSWVAPASTRTSRSTPLPCWP